MIKIKQRIFLPIALAVALTGCAGNGFSIDEIFSNPVSVIFEYTHSYDFLGGNEEEWSLIEAESHCKRYNKHALQTDKKMVSLDRTRVVFECVKP